MATGSPPRKRRERRVTPNGTLVGLARKSLGYTQRELAARIGVHYSLIAQVERGWCPISERLAVLLADALSLPVEALIERSTEATA